MKQLIITADDFGMSHDFKMAISDLLSLTEQIRNHTDKL